MLVLSRTVDQSIIISDNIVATVVRIDRDKVRIGVDAPIDISVHRKETYEKIQRENQRQGTTGLDRLQSRHGLVSRLKSLADEFRLRGDTETSGELTAMIEGLKTRKGW